VAALASWLDARAAGGEWLLRIEDVDAPRTVPGAEGEILRALDALGLHWDGPVLRQKGRDSRYAEVLARLRGAGHVYRCRCSRKEIADSAMTGIEGPVYPGTCRGLALAPSVDGADRLRVPHGVVTFEDRVMGPVAQDLARDIGDFVLRRREGLFAYQLAVVVDDADQGITDVVRGADLLFSTPRQILLQRLLGFPTPRYLHVPVATNAGGQKLSKQSLAAPVDLARPVESLANALKFLGQSVTEDSRADSLVAAAAKCWNPLGVSRQYARAIP